MKRFVKTKFELAQLIGISRPALDRIIRQNATPGLTESGLYDVERWRNFALSHYCGWNERVFPQ